MVTEQQTLDLACLEGYKWMDNGQSALSGKALRLFNRLDLLFLSWAQEFRASQYQFPTFIAARELAKLDYFGSFPQLVTLPVTLESTDENLERFVSGGSLDDGGNLNLTTLAPVRDVLTPAACYHVYIDLQGSSLEQPRHLTTRATCFRKESRYLPLQRQWSFVMREIVCMGSADEVTGFLEDARQRVNRFFKDAGLAIKWLEATDPFFKPSRNPKYLMQKLDPVKTEMVFADSLAIGSVNFHRNYFGETFQIMRNGEDAYSGCVAFGLERWMYACLSHFGVDEALWPLPELKA
jgi:seryl-tRNA synthetase